MVTELVPGPRTWSMARDKDGHREYKIISLVRSNNPRDGPATVINTPGLYVPGAVWYIGEPVYGYDVDMWALCHPDANVKPVLENEANYYWTVEQKFSTKPLNRCEEFQIESPLLEPMKVSGSFTRYTHEATHDRYGNPIKNSSHEQLRGPQVEFDRGRPTVKIEQNVALLGLSTFAPMHETVNTYPIWGLPRRTVKLSGISWERKYHSGCYVYYTRTFEFEVDYRGWDRTLLDEGYKALWGHWDTATGDWVLDPINEDLDDPDPADPTHFTGILDRTGNKMRVPLDGSGRPYKPGIVTTCSQCPAPIGAPRHWRVFNLAGVYGLSYVSDCTWQSSSASHTLVYASGFWQLFDTDFNQWTLAGSLWNCLGPNLLTRSLGVGPETVLLANGPGTVRIEYYPESDFSILGVDFPF